MFDLEFHLSDQPGQLAALGEAMGVAGVAFEGGAVFTRDGGQPVAHFLFHDGYAAKQAAEIAGIKVIAMHQPLIRRLKQGTPGQLGAIARALSEAGVNILVQYSDHHNRLVLICDDAETAQVVTKAWADEG